MKPEPTMKQVALSRAPLNLVFNETQLEQTVAPHKRAVIEPHEGVSCRHRVVRGHARQRTCAVGAKGHRRASLNALNNGVQNTVRVDRGVPSSLSHRFGVGSSWHGGILQKSAWPFQVVVRQSVSKKFVVLLEAATTRNLEADA